MKKINIYKSLKFFAIIWGTYWIVRNLLYFISTWSELHSQGITNLYLGLTTIMGFWLIIPFIFIPPYLPLFFIKPEDKVPKLFLKCIGYGFLGITISGTFALLWFFYYLD